MARVVGEKPKEKGSIGTKGNSPQQERVRIAPDAAERSEINNYPLAFQLQEGIGRAVREAVQT